MLAAHQLLAVVDEGEALDPIRRSVALWQLVDASQPPDALWQAPVGCRDRALLDLRAAEIGPKLELADTCKQCGQELEFPAEVSGLRLPTAPFENQPFEVDAAGRPLLVRVVSSADLVAAANDPELDLLLRCIVGGPLHEAPLRREERAAVDAALAAADPQADISFDLDCPECGAHWSSLFDIGEVLWTELHQRSRRLLLEVDILARAYHWSEADILRLPASRRRRYLDLVSS